MWLNAFTMHSQGMVPLQLYDLINIMLKPEQTDIVIIMIFSYLFPQVSNSSYKETNITATSSYQRNNYSEL